MDSLETEAEKIAKSMKRYHYLGYDDLRQCVAIGLFLHKKKYGNSNEIGMRTKKWRSIANEVRSLARSFDRFNRLKKETVLATPGIRMHVNDTYITPTASRIMSTTEEVLYV